MEYQTTLLVSWETSMWVKKQQLELYMEQQTVQKHQFFRAQLSSHWPASWETYIQVKKQQLELYMEQQTVSK